MNDELTADELNALEYLRAAWGNRWKAKLRWAWESGDYTGMGGFNAEAVLQTLRNTRGPSWLNNFRFPVSQR